MKLRNKKTGEIHEITQAVFLSDNMNKKVAIYSQSEGHNYAYKTLTELNEEWEDYEEPKEWWYVDIHGPHKVTNNDEYYQQVEAASKQIGNYFETKEEAEKAVEKLKAWKRLKDKGFRPKMWEWEYIYPDNMSGELTVKAHIDDATDYDGKYTKDLDLLFGGEE